MSEPSLLPELLTGEVRKGATFSTCRKYRFTLTRIWGDAPYCMFIGLNPSTADETLDDPTIRRCIRFARDWGYGGLVMCNVFGYRSTCPKGLLRVGDPIGTCNDLEVFSAAKDCAMIVAAWGANDLAQIPAPKLASFLNRDLHCLGKTKGGFPRHPLYVKADTTPVLYWAATPEAGEEGER